MSTLAHHPPAIAVPANARSEDAPGTFAYGVVRSLVLALCLSLLYVYFPWDDFSAAGFPDRESYLQGIDVLMASGARPFDFTGTDLITVLTNEFLWRQVLVILGTYFQNPLEGFLIVCVITCTLLMYHVIRRAGLGYALLTLSCPLTIDLVMSQTRSALAVACFMFALEARGRTLRYVLLFGAFFIHTFGAILFLLFHFDALVLAWRRLSSRQKIVAVMAAGLAASVTMAFLSEIILLAVGDRRAAQMALLPSTITFAIWWLILTAMFAAFARLRTQPARGHFVLTAVFMQSVFVFSTFLATGALRFLSLALPASSIAIQTFPSRSMRIGAAAGTLVFNIVYFAFYWLAW